MAHHDTCNNNTYRCKPSIYRLTWRELLNNSYLPHMLSFTIENFADKGTCYLSPINPTARCLRRPGQPPTYESALANAFIYALISSHLLYWPLILTQSQPDQRLRGTDSVMSSANSTIQYNSLETNEIRLLLLLPGSGNEAICCELTTVKLQNEGYEKVPVYRALSNVWGKPQPTSQTYTSRAPFEVRSNLFEALKQLRYSYFSRYLWEM